MRAGRMRDSLVCCVPGVLLLWGCCCCHAPVFWARRLRDLPVVHGFDALLKCLLVHMAWHTPSQRHGPHVDHGASTRSSRNGCLNTLQALPETHAMCLNLKTAASKLATVTMSHDSCVHLVTRLQVSLGGGDVGKAANSYRADDIIEEDVESM